MEIIWMTLALFMGVGIFYFFWIVGQGRERKRGLRVWWMSHNTEEKFCVLFVSAVIYGVIFLVRIADLDKAAQMAAEREADKKLVDWYHDKQQLESVVWDKARAVVEGDMARANALQKEDERLRKKLRDK